MHGIIEIPVEDLEVFKRIFGRYEIKQFNKKPDEDGYIAFFIFNAPARLMKRPSIQKKLHYRDPDDSWVDQLYCQLTVVKKRGWYASALGAGSKSSPRCWPGEKASR